MPVSLLSSPYEKRENEETDPGTVPSFFDNDAFTAGFIGFPPTATT
jgi:hypothetical protein